MAASSPVVAAFQQATRTVPIVFAGVIDPVGAGFVARLARPGGNTTGFALFQYGISGKWLALLKVIAVNRHWIGTPDQRPKGTPLIGVC